MDITTAAVVLAGGAGNRLNSSLHQVLHKVADVPLVCHALGMVSERGWGPVVVVTNPQNNAAIREALAKTFPGMTINFEVQQESGSCLQAAELGLRALKTYEGNVMVLPANMPLLQANTTLLCLEAMIAEDPQGNSAPYVGLVQRGAARYYPVFCGAKQWLEQSLAAVHGHMAEDGNSSAASWIQDLQQTLPRGGPDADSNALAHFAAAGFAVNAASEDDLCVVASRADLASAESLLKGRLIARHQQQGVTFRDPEGTFLGANVSIGRDTTLGVGVQIYGDTIIGEGARIEGPTCITDSSVESGVFIRSFTVLEGAHISEGSGAGPFARLREGTDIAPNSYIGNFVETKNARIGRNTLACHLTYLGDAEIGSRTNIGAGTITCNFDGAKKNATTIGDNCFVGSNSTLVAPVSVGSEAIIAAGSAITENVPAKALAFGRSRQILKEDRAEAVRKALQKQP